MTLEEAASLLRGYNLGTATPVERALIVILRDIQLRIMKLDGSLSNMPKSADPRELLSPISEEDDLVSTAIWALRNIRQDLNLPKSTMWDVLVNCLTDTPLGEAIGWRQDHIWACLYPEDGE